MLKRNVSLSTYNLPMLWLDPHLKDRVLFMPPPFPQPKGYSVARRGRGYYFWYGSRRRWLWTELATSSLEGLDTFYVHIT